jgi:hypothetical protein
MAASTAIAGPTVVTEWNPLKILQVPSTNAPCMGIRHLRVEGTLRPLDGSAIGNGGYATCRLVWITSCGWVLQAELESRGNGTLRKKSKVLFSTRPVHCINDRGEEVDLPAHLQTWSLPVAGKVVADSAQSALVWEKVVEVTRILPHHDKRVLDSQQGQLVRSLDEKPGLHVMTTNNSRVVQTVRLSRKRTGGSPTAVAIHPSHEWMVVGTASNGFYALNTRRSPNRNVPNRSGMGPSERTAN